MSRGSRYALHLSSLAVLSLAMATCVSRPAHADGDRCTAADTVIANVVALDTTIWFNRLGTHLPGAMIYALERDVCAVPPSGQASLPNGQAICGSVDPDQFKPGQVMLKPYKRPRPMVLRVNEGQCLEVRFRNLLSKTQTANVCTSNDSIACDPPTRGPKPSQPLEGCPLPIGACKIPPGSSQGTCVNKGFKDLVGGCASDADCVACRPKDPGTRWAGVHVQGLEWTGSAGDDGSWVGKNASSLVAPGDDTEYLLYAKKPGTFVLYSTADMYSHTAPQLRMGGVGGQLAAGLFGAVHVEPAGAEAYRSQVTRRDLAAAAQGSSAYHQPLVDYRARYRNDLTDPCYQKGLCRVGPVLAMLCDEESAAAGWCALNELVHSDLTAVITGPGAGRFPAREGDENPELESSYALPDRLQPFREFTVMYHDSFRLSQAFARLYDKPDGHTRFLRTALKSGADTWAINYGAAGIGNEIIANRLGVGPMGQCTSCKYEEFFLSSWAVGDPAMVVDKPASTVRCDGKSTYACTGGSSAGKACRYGVPDDGVHNPEGCDCRLDYACEEEIPPTRALYPDDPTNVYHSYLNDHARFRVLHGGYDLHHLHHQHAHQWLHSPNTANGDYTDSQSIGPGSGFTMEMVYNGGGNVNQTAGDAIFHCHFYPHFAGGMWSLWRVHDVFEEGTELDRDGRVERGARALPDGEIVTGTPIPAVVPLPTLPMAPMPAKVQLADDGKIAEVCDVNGEHCISNQAGAGTSDAGYDNPGYPFFIPGLAGQRAPHPPMDFAYACMKDGESTGESCVPGDGRPRDFNAELGAGTCSDPDAVCTPLDGGLPRHIVEACEKGSDCYDAPDVNQTDYSKTLTSVSAFQLPEGGTRIEQVAMAAHGTRRLIDSVTPPAAAPPPGNPAACSPTCDGGACAADSSVACAEDADCFSTCTVDGYTVGGSEPDLRPAKFVVNGLPPVPGAPFADPCIRYDLDGGHIPLLDHNTRYYRAADIQLDAVFNKEGWHFPQQRMISLWGDVAATLSGERPPEPLFFRSNSGECISYTLANLVPNVYELDDFQVRTPTDILGQHIHLVKFDVTSSDGAANGFNYEDGTFAPNEVTERIRAINNGYWQPLPGGDAKLTARGLPYFGPGPGGQWLGAQATVQRFYGDPLLNGTSPSRHGETRDGRPAVDRTLRTVFTHDHFSPSTHQQAGLYAGLVMEPVGSKWYQNETGELFGGVDLDACTGAGPYPTFGCPIVNADRPGDGGPTTWQAVIEVPDEHGQPSDASFREFLLQVQDSTLMYESFTEDFRKPPAGYGFCSNDPSKNCRLATWQEPENVVRDCGDSFATCNRVAGIPSQKASGWQIPAAGWATNAIDAQPPAGPELITLSGATNNFSLNYRNEPLFPRINSSSREADAADLAFAYSSHFDRGYQRGRCSDSVNSYCWPDSPNCARCVLGGFCADDNSFCSDDEPCASGAACQVFPYQPLTADLDYVTPGHNGDPFTPLLRAYTGDDVQIRALIGAHVNPHNVGLHGLDWLMEPSFVESGWRSNLVMGISEHFEMLVRIPSLAAGDYLYQGGASWIEQAGGNWGLVRAYAEEQPASRPLRPLPQNPPRRPRAAAAVCPACAEGDEACRRRRVDYQVVALTAQQALGGPLVYTEMPNIATGPPLRFEDADAILFINRNDLDCPDRNFQTCTLKATKAEPLVLRAAAGDCIRVTLHNAIDPGKLRGKGQTNPVSPSVPSTISTTVGLHPQLVSYDVTAGGGFNVGRNPEQTVAALAGPAGASRTVPSTTYTWYAGHIDGGEHVPVEFGAANLVAPDPVNHYDHALFGALIIEPADWSNKPPSGAHGLPSLGTAARIETERGEHFWDFVILTPDGLGAKVEPFNYQANPMWLAPFGARTCGQPADLRFPAHCTLADSPDSTCTYLKAGTGSFSEAVVYSCAPDNVPVFPACAGDQVRFRFLHPGGTNTNQVMEIYGHVWAEAPYESTTERGCEPPTTQTNLYASARIGDRDTCPSGAAPKPSLNEWDGSRAGHGPHNHMDVVIDQAGGSSRVPGDYLVRSFPAMHFMAGPWGIFRVVPPCRDGRCAGSGEACTTAADCFPAGTAVPEGFACAAGTWQRPYEGASLR